MKKFVITNSDNSKMNVELIRYFKFKNDCFLIYTLGEKDEKNYFKLYLVRIMEELGFPVVQTIRNDADWNSMQDIVKKVLKELKKGKKKLTEDLDYSEVNGIKITNPRFFKLDSKLVDLLSSNYMEDNLTDLSDELSYSIDSSSTNSNLDNSKINGLEPIEQTMMKQSMEYNQTDFNDESENVPIFSIEDDQDDGLPSNEAALIDKSIVLSSDKKNSNVENNTIDYKKLYESLKADNDATTDLLNAVMHELSIYKEKYGELNIN